MLNEKTYSELLALHNKGKLSELERVDWSREKQTAYSLYHYNRSAAIGKLIGIEKEKAKEKPNESIIAELQKEMTIFLELASRYPYHLID